MMRAYLSMLLLVLLCASSPRGANLENPIKAGVLFHFIRLIEWPPESQMAKANEITIGVFGKNPFGPSLDALNGKMVKGRTVRVKQVTSIEELSRCPVAILGPVEDNQLESVLQQLEGSNVLTISESEDFARRGGVIRLFEVQHKVRFEINRTAARKAGLTISSEILKLATIVPS